MDMVEIRRGIGLVRELLAPGYGFLHNAVASVMLETCWVKPIAQKSVANAKIKWARSFNCNIQS